MVTTHETWRRSLAATPNPEPGAVAIIRASTGAVPDQDGRRRMPSTTHPGSLDPASDPPGTRQDTELDSALAKLDPLLATARRVAESLELETVLAAIVEDATNLAGADSGSEKLGVGADLGCSDAAAERLWVEGCELQ